MPGNRVLKRIFGKRLEKAAQREAP